MYHIVTKLAFSTRMLSVMWTCRRNFQWGRREREDLHLCLCLSLLLPSHVTKIFPKLSCSLGSFFTIFGIFDVHRLKSSSFISQFFYNKIDEPSILITTRKPVGFMQSCFLFFVECCVILGLTTHIIFDLPTQLRDVQQPIEKNFKFSPFATKPQIAKILKRCLLVGKKVLYKSPNDIPFKLLTLHAVNGRFVFTRITRMAIAQTPDPKKIKQKTAF